ncbi:Do family serine endopeptidase [Brucepastera parasyntrophica]|uniref:Do family serine endopeptidase n=1 Tax=Brucepastera parasyntrophica TaxID=2880008 RepID=UPI0021095E21|nr:Do family serine endopeptidase [Brucepastera parasyntrophica]ULQ60345.1 Do family serine endopeptidase [Brucepastera parasyntrophica]
MSSITKKTKNALLIAAGALLCFSLGVFVCLSVPGTAQTAYADTIVTPTVSEESIAFLEQMQNANRSVATAILPAVVTLDVVEMRTVQNNPFRDFPWFFFGNPRGEKDGESDSNKREYRTEGLGSGVIVRKAGKTYYVLTNQHVAGAANEIYIRMHDGREYTGKLVGADERKDIALVSFESDDSSIPVARMGDSDTVQPGDIVFAVGSPLGYVSSLTQGVVSAVGRSGGPNNNINDFIQTDAAINQGNSGGPLVNIYGEIVGINSWIASSSGGSQGLGFSIPINNVKKAVDDFISGGKVKYGWLGVSLMNADKETLTALGVADNKKAALASQVFINSPADKGGILPGDLVIAMNDKEVRSVDQLVRDIGDLASGSVVKFRIVRNKKEMDVTVTIGERDEKQVADSSKLWPGFIPYQITKDITDRLKLDANQKGVVVANVQAKSPAAVMGLQSGDIITAVNGKPVADIADFYNKLSDKTAREFWFDVLRDGHTVSTMRYKK